MALNQISLSFADTGLVSIVGPSGCGKTTLLNILGGLDAASSGSVIYNGSNIEEFSDSDWDMYRSNDLGFVFQNYNLLEDLTVRKNLELPLLLDSSGTDRSFERIDKLAEDFGMSDLLSKKAKHLSGGQKQRVAILRAIVKQPGIILADEPTGNLDRDNSRFVYRLLKEISRNCLVIVVSHDRELSEEYSDRIIELSYGEIMKDTIKENEQREQETADGHERKACRTAKLPFLFCASLVLDSFKARFVRFAIALFMMTITMTMILLCTVCVFNNRKGILSKYIKDRNTGIHEVYMPVGASYEGYLGNPNKIINNGDEFSELLNQCIGEEQVILVNDYAMAEYKDDMEEIMFLGADPTSELLCGHKLGDSQVIINGVYASKINISEQNLPVAAKIGNYDVRIVGIADFDIAKRQSIFVGNKSLWMTIAQENISEIKGIDFVSAGGANEIAESMVTVGSIESLQGPLVAGRLPNSENEIAVSKRYIESWERRMEDVLGYAFYTYNLRDDKFGNSYYDTVNLWDIVGEKMVVTGVVDGECDYYFQDNTYRNIILKAGSYQGSLAFTGKSKQLNKMISELDKNGIRIDDENLANLYAEWDEMDELVLFLVVGIVIMGLLTLLQMISTFSYSIKDSEHKIGIFRSMGVPQKSINMMFILESVSITILAELFASAVSFLCIRKVNRYYADEVFRVADMNLVQPKVAVWLLCLAAIVLVYSIVVLIPLQRAKKKKVMKLLLNE